MKIILDTKDNGDVKLVRLIAAVIGAEGVGMFDGANGTEAEETEAEETEAEETEAEETEVGEPEVGEPEVGEPEVGEPEELDADGVPWDEKIHASTRNKTANGKWRKIRVVGGSAPKTTETKKEELTTQETPDQAALIAACTAHKDKYGVDRTLEIIQGVSGATHARDIKPEDRAGVIDALNNDKPDAAELSLDDF